MKERELMFLFIFTQVTSDDTFVTRFDFRT